MAFLDFTGPMSLAQLPSDRHKGLVNSSLPSSVINTTDKKEQKNRRRRNLLEMEELEGNDSIAGGKGGRLPGAPLGRWEREAGVLWARRKQREGENMSDPDKVITVNSRL